MVQAFRVSWGTGSMAFRPTVINHSTNSLRTQNAEWRGVPEGVPGTVDPGFDSQKEATHLGVPRF